MDNFLRNNNFLHYILKNVRQFFNKDFRNYVCNYRLPLTGVSEERIRNLHVYQLGNENIGKVILYLQNDSGYGGFCAIWLYFLNRLAFSEKMGFVHCINWVKSENYKEKHLVWGTGNIFEYYFLQPYGIEPESALRSYAVVFDENTDDLGFNDAFHAGGVQDYTETDKDIEDFSLLQQKYIHLRPEVNKMVQQDMNRLLGQEKTIGIHARGTDYKIGYKNHPSFVSAEQYIIASKQLLKETGATKIFLATDDEEILSKFKDTFGEENLLYYQDVIRSKGNRWNCSVNSHQENGIWRLGYEIIRDVYTLSSCSSLICSLSYVGVVAQIVNKAEKKPYDFVIKLTNGLNTNGFDLTDEKVRDQIKKEWKAK